MTQEPSKEEPNGVVPSEEDLEKARGPKAKDINRNILSARDVIRFLTSFEIDGKESCWNWKRHKIFGYGVFSIRNKNRKAHRVSWLLFRENIKNGLCVLHKCDNRSCVNPNHLFLGTNLDNMRDAQEKGRFWYKGRPSEDVCRKGHKRTPENTELRKDGKRRCSVCKKISYGLWLIKNSEKVNANRRVRYEKSRSAS